MKTFLITFLIVFLSSCLQAHDPGLSAAIFKLEKESINLHLSVAQSDILHFSTTQESLEAFIRKTVHLQLDDQQLILDKILIEFDQLKAVDFYLNFSRQEGSVLRYSCFLSKNFPFGHRQYVSFLDENGQLFGNQLLSANNDSYEVKLENTALSKLDSSFSGFLSLGIKHIFLGYDHIAFLLMVLLGSRCLKGIVQIITSFTIAHSMTLALSTLKLVTIPSSLAEILIACSILYIGLENIFKKNINPRWISTFGFGLIHGFGFASVLQELGIEESVNGIILPLLSFNLGVEVGQLVIAIVVLPFLVKLQNQTLFSYRLVPICSIGVSLLACYWIFERVVIVIYS